MSETKVLVTIQEITNVRRHINADQLIMATIQGYEVIVRPDAFGESMDTFQNLKGRRGVMFYIDSVIPKEYEDSSNFSFLSNSYMGKRVRTLKLRKEYSQGLFLSFQSVKSLISLDYDSLPVGTDLTNEFKVVKYYESNDGNNPNNSTCFRPFPEWFPKTDQKRLQENVSLLENAVVRLFVTTLKVDGQSATFFYNPEQKESGMCSRNYQLGSPADKNFPIQFELVNQQYKILQKLSNLGLCLAIQGEIYGADINGNRLKLKEIDFTVFDIYECDPNNVGRYLSHSEMVKTCELLELKPVPVVKAECMLSELPLSISEWVQLAEKQTYDALSPAKNLLAEGIVVKTCDNLRPCISFKVISRAYLEKYNL